MRDRLPTSGSIALLTCHGAALALSTPTGAWPEHHEYHCEDTTSPPIAWIVVWIGQQVNRYYLPNLPGWGRRSVSTAPGGHGHDWRNPGSDAQVLTFGGWDAMIHYWSKLRELPWPRPNDPNVLPPGLFGR